MPIEKQTIYNTIGSEVHKASDLTLNAPNFENALYQTHSLKTPSLNKNQTKVTPGKAVPDYEKDFVSFSFGFNKQLEFALYEVLIIGNAETFRKIVGKALFQGKIYVNNDKLIYKEFSETTIIGNAIEKERIKENAKRSINEVEQLVEVYNDEVYWFNKDELAVYIKETIETEKKRRQSGDDTAKDLNPFI